MYRQQRLNCLDLDNDRIFHQQIKSVCANKPLAVEDLNRLLPDKSNTASIQFDTKGFFVQLFDKSWPQTFMHLKRGIKHLLSNMLYFHWDGSITWFVPRFAIHVFIFLLFVSWCLNVVVVKGCLLRLDCLNRFLERV